MTSDTRFAHGGDVKRSLEELHELINLAEQVSYDLIKSRSVAWKQVGFVFIVLASLSSVILIFALTQPKILEFSAGVTLSSLVVGLGISVLISTYAVAILTMWLNKKKWRVERQIVAEIVVMASSILDLVQVSIGSVEYTVLKMRMRRLGLSEGSAFAGIRFA